MLDSENALPLESYIRWQKAFDTSVLLINEQHQGILNFINHWYHQVKQKQGVIKQPQFMKKKCDFLLSFTKGHLRFESELLRLLMKDYGFPETQYKLHTEKHRWFLESFLLPLTKQLSSEKEPEDQNLLEDIATAGLFDTARWWYNHVRSPGKGEEPSPDQIYRTHLDNLSTAAKLEIVNRMALYIALNDNTFWLKDISSSLE